MFGLKYQDARRFFCRAQNPQQTPAYAYHPRYSPQSPKFSRAVALVSPEHTTTWLSGTASVVHSLSRHPATSASKPSKPSKTLKIDLSGELRIPRSEPGRGSAERFGQDSRLPETRRRFCVVQSHLRPALRVRACYLRGRGCLPAGVAGGDRRRSLLCKDRTGRAIVLDCAAARAVSR